MTLVALIFEHCSAEAAAGDWTAVAANLSADVPGTDSTLKGSAVVLTTLGAADGEATLRAFAASETGKVGLAKLAATGLDFSHPITRSLILAVSGVLPAGAADKLLALGETHAPLAGRTVTADECREAFEAAQLSRDWTECLNELIHPAEHDRAKLIQALHNSIESLGG